MLLLVGQVPRAFRGREAWQELDYARGLRRDREGRAGRSTRAARIPEHVAEAYSLALSGRPGPVVLALPEDVLAEEADVDDARAGRDAARRAARGRSRAAARAARRRRAPTGRRRGRRLDGDDEPRRPGLLRGERAPGRLRRSAARTSSTTARRATSASSASAMDERIAAPPARRGSRARHRRSTRRGSDPALHAARAPRPRQTLVHVHPGRERARPRLRCRTSRSQRRCPSSPRRCAALGPRRAALGATWTAAARADYDGEPPARADGGRSSTSARSWRSSAARLPGDAIQTCGAGNFTVWAHRFAEFTQFGTQACPRSGLDGIRTPGCGRGEARPSGPGRRVLHGRRRLRDELARARDGRAVRAARSSSSS